jgi:pimeloyl-ACP methyl ester carboxylesterase
MDQQIASDFRMAYDDAGQGAAVVLLHAFPLERGMWRPQSAALPGGCRLLTPDLRGFGGSGGWTGPPSVEQMADDVAGLLDALAVREPVVLGGLSMGGYVALAFARRHPQRLRGLILADTRAEADNDEARANRDRLIAFAETHPARDVLEQMLPRLVSDGTRQHRSEVIEEVRRLASAQSPAGISGALRAMRDRPDSRPFLGRIRVPTLVLVGSEDVLTPPTMAQTLVEGIAGARLATLPGAGHLSNLEQPAAFNAALGEFVVGLPSDDRAVR